MYLDLIRKEYSLEKFNEDEDLYLKNIKKTLGLLQGWKNRMTPYV